MDIQAVSMSRLYLLSCSRRAIFFITEKQDTLKYYDTMIQSQVHIPSRQLGYCTKSYMCQIQRKIYLYGEVLSFLFARSLYTSLLSRHSLSLSERAQVTQDQ